MPQLKLDTPIEDVPSVQKRFLPKLKRLGIETVRDLLWHFPARYEDWSEMSDIIDLKSGDEKTIQGIIQKVRQTKTFKRRMFITEIVVADKTGSIRAVWFNQPYIGQILKEGKLINLSGKTALSKNELYMSNPIYEMAQTIKHGDTPRHTARIVPIYPETKGLTSRGIRFILLSALEQAEKLKEFIPVNILKELDIPEINIAIHNIHIPDNTTQVTLAKKRFAFQDLFLLQLKNESEKRALKRQTATAITSKPQYIEAILKSLPFEFTDSQRTALDEILGDIGERHPMNRLLQGDVGSGKTIVAGISAVITADKPNMLQSVFMAPTEILARQHYKTLSKFFRTFTGGIGLITSKEARVFYGGKSETKTTKQELIKDISAGSIKIIIGTHAVLQKNIEFKNLGLIVVDEQHRFGVKQRAKLTHSENGKFSPHFLSMSATPIPRTLMMTVFGNLDISLINELPIGRRQIITKIVSNENRDKAYAFIRGEVRKGRQVFVVCPRIEENPDTKNTVWDVKAVETEYKKLSERVFPDLRIGMIHGKMPAKSSSKSAEKSKEEIMREFADGKIDVLVATSVIEVGIDIPNATIMMIEGAERFGLAQLYQFRGRVGRGEHQSFCLLFTDSETKLAHKRLNSLITAKNSFELAEKDLELRGPGEFLGESQSGLPDIAMNAIQNPELLKTAEIKVKEILKEDPELKSHPILKEYLEEFNSKIHLE